jgi:hypothetical protein
MYGSSITLNLKGEVRQTFQRKAYTYQQTNSPVAQHETEAKRMPPHYELLLRSTSDRFTWPSQCVWMPHLANEGKCLYIACKQWVVKAGTLRGQFVVYFVAN